jgi:hypothetical protein
MYYAHAPVYVLIKSELTVFSAVGYITLCPRPKHRPGDPSFGHSNSPGSSDAILPRTITRQALSQAILYPRIGISKLGVDYHDVTVPYSSLLQMFRV